MKSFPPLVALALALSPQISHGQSYGQSLDLGADITTLQRFQVYPHLEKGFDAMRRGDRLRALAEFEQAHQLAPNNAAVALYLVDAYRRFGDNARAESLLVAQLKRTPGHPRLARALADLKAARVAPSNVAAPAPPPSAAIQTPPVALPAAPAEAVVPPSLTPPPSIRPSARAPAPRARRVAPMRAPSPPPPASEGDTAAREAYVAASRAFEASGRGDHEAALVHARTAVRLAPDNSEYRRLLIYSLIETGRYGEAQAEALQVENVSDSQPSPAWQQLRDTARQRKAFSHFVEANEAMERGDMVTALTQSRMSLAEAPNALPQRLQVLGLLLQDRQYARAQQVAEEGLARADDAALRVLHGAALQGQGRAAEAAQAFDAALAAPGLAAHEQHNYRVIAADAALAARQPQRAQALLDPLRQGGDAGVLARQAEIDTAMRRAISPASLYTTAFRMPAVNCFGAAYTPGCEIWPGAHPADPASDIAQAAYRAFSQRDYADAADKAAQAAERNPAHVPYRLLRLQALVAGGQAEQAVAEADAFLLAHPNEPEVLALRSRVRRQMGQREAASSDARAALQAGGLSLSSEVDLLLQEERQGEAARRFASAVAAPGLRESDDPDLAYLATRVGDYRTGAEVFGRAHAAGRLPVTSLQDAGYTATRVADNAQSVRYFREAIDAADDGRLQLTPRQKFATRRELSDRVRTWGVNALLGYRGMSPGSVAAQPSGFGDTVQAVAEGYWRPHGFRDGSFWEVYGGVAQTLYARHGGPKGADTTQGAIGLRAKPLREHNLVLSVERRFKIGSLSSNDWLLRAGYSGGFGTDLRVDVPHWNTLNIYAEAGRLLRRKQDYVTFEAQAGRSFRLGDEQGRWVLFPHAVVGVDYNSLRTPAGYNGAAGLGAGLGARYWFREDKYHAPRSYLDLSVQYRARLAGDERGKGWFVRAALAY